MDKKEKDLMEEMLVEVKDGIFSEISPMDLFLGICGGYGVGLLTMFFITNSRIESRHKMQLLMNLNNKEEF